MELSGATVPENEHPELEPLTVPLEMIVTVVAVPSIRLPVQVPEIAESDACVLKLKVEAGSDAPVKVILVPFSVRVPFRLEP